MSEWRKHFPYSEPRDIQAEALDILEENWDKYDIFVINAPTAFGKTALARTLINQYHSVSVITPTNLLVQQFLDEFPDTPTLHRMDSYFCEKWDRPCPVTRAKLMNFCNEKRDGQKCQAACDLSAAKYKKGPGIYNYHTFVAHKLYRNIIIIDEAHNTIPFLKERMAITIWKHDYKYPDGFSYEGLKEWILKLPQNKQKHKKIQLLKQAVSYKVPTHIAQFTTEKFNGKGTRRGFPEERECIKLMPVDISDAPPLLWPGEKQGVQKVLLLSATIGPKDIEQLGIGGRKLLYVDCKHPIPPPNRPILPLDVASVNYNSLRNGVALELANEIEKIAEYHTGEKGVIHATYQLATEFRAHLSSDRFLFHTRQNKADVYSQFRESDPAKGKILIACGMYEGIDLPEDLGRWQVIAKIPWMSLANPAIQHLVDLDPQWFLWETLKTTIQAAGRICRTPTDYGITYILDSSFRRLMENGRTMVPDWFMDAIQEVENE